MPPCPPRGPPRRYRYVYQVRTAHGDVISQVSHVLEIESRSNSIDNFAVNCLWLLNKYGNDLFLTICSVSSFELIQCLFLFFIQRYIQALRKMVPNVTKPSALQSAYALCDGESDTDMINGGTWSTMATTQDSAQQRFK